MMTQPAVLLEHSLKELKWPTVLLEYARLADVCTPERSESATDLLRLAERTVIEREHRAAARRVKAAGFPMIKTLDSFDFSAQPSVNEALVRELIRSDYRVVPHDVGKAFRRFPRFRPVLGHPRLGHG